MLEPKAESIETEVETEAVSRSVRLGSQSPKKKKPASAEGQVKAEWNIFVEKSSAVDLVSVKGDETRKRRKGISIRQVLLTNGEVEEEWDYGSSDKKILPKMIIYNWKD